MTMKMITILMTPPNNDHPNWEIPDDYDDEYDQNDDNNNNDNNNDDATL